jgi:hypothetical protein
MKDAKIYGSLIQIQPVDFEYLYQKIEEHSVSIFDLKEISDFVQSAQMLSMKYDVVVTNPPYMGGSGMNAQLSEFVKKNFADSKSDLFACFIEKLGMMTKPNGYYSMITQHAFMFLSSYEKLRVKLANKTIVNMAHLGARAFDEIGGEVVQTTAFVNYNSHIKNYLGTYSRLVDVNGESEKEHLYLSRTKIYTVNQENFSKIPGSPVAYWVGENFVRAFENPKLGDYGRTCQGLATADNNKFLRLWYECDYNNVFWNCSSHEESYKSPCKWYPCTKGGSFRRWYGNIEYLVDWYQDGKNLKNFKSAVIRNPNYYFKKAYTWSTISSGKFSMRYAPIGSIFESKGSKCFVDNKNFNYILGMLNSCVAQEMLTFLAPTLDYHEGPVSRIPIKFPFNYSVMENIERIVDENVSISKEDWDSFETSWDFKKHPLV